MKLSETKEHYYYVECVARVGDADCDIMTDSEMKEWFALFLEDMSPGDSDNIAIEYVGKLTRESYLEACKQYVVEPKESP